MYVIREVFTAKPGQASKLAKLFTKMTTGEMKGRVMTDMVGPYNTVIMEWETDSLANWEKEMDKMRSGEPDPAIEKLDAETKEAMSHYHDMFISGQREIFRVVD